MLWHSSFWLTILNISPIVRSAVRRSNSDDTPSFDGSFDGAHFPPTSPFGASFKEYTNLPKFPGGTDNMIDFPGTYSGQFAGPFPVPFQIPFPKPFPAALSNPRIYPSQFFNSFSAFSPHFQNNFPFHPFSGGHPFNGAFPYPGSFSYPGSYPYPGIYPYAGSAPFAGSTPFSGSYPFASGRPFPFTPFPPPPLLPPPPTPTNPTSSSVVLQTPTAATLAAAKLIYGIVTRYSNRILPYPVTNPIPLAVPEGVRVPVAVDRPVPIRDIRPLHYEEIMHSNVERIPPSVGINSMHYEDIVQPNEFLPPIGNIKSTQFGEFIGPIIKSANIEDTKLFNYEESISPDEVNEILDGLDATQELAAQENDLKTIHLEEIIGPTVRPMNIKYSKPLNYEENISTDVYLRIPDDLDAAQELVVHENSLNDVN